MLRRALALPVSIGVAATVLAFDGPFQIALCGARVSLEQAARSSVAHVSSVRRPPFATRRMDRRFFKARKLTDDALACSRPL